MAAIAVAVLLLSFLDAAFRGLWEPTYRMGAYLATAIAIWDVPYFSPTLNAWDRLTLISSFYYLYGTLVSLSSAWILSRWLYGMGPFRTLASVRKELLERKHD